MSCIFNEVANFTEVNFITTKNYHHRENTRVQFYRKVGTRKLTWKTNFREFLGRPVVRTPCFHCQGPGLNPGRGTKILQAVAWQRKKRKKKLFYFRKKMKKFEHLCLKQLKGNIFFIGTKSSSVLIFNSFQGKWSTSYTLSKSLSSVSHAVVFKYLVRNVFPLKQVIHNEI